MENRDQLVVVTGASRGIGFAIARRFARLNFHIALNARDPQRLAECKAELEAEGAASVLAIVADFEQPEHIQTFAQAVLDLNLHIAVLVNNAGTFIPGSISEEAPGTFEKLMALNVAGAYHFTRALLPALKGQGRGHIFTICSIASITAYANGGSYCISKFALLGFSKVLREELKPMGIRVTAILPGATRTESWNGTDLPDDRFIQPEDVAAALVGAWQLSPSTVIEELLIRPQLGDI